MQDRKDNFRFPLAWLAGIAGFILLVGGGTAWWAKYSLEKAGKVSVPNNPPIESSQTPTTPQNQLTTEQPQQIQIGWLDTTGTNVKLVAKTLSFPKSADNQQILQGAFEQLLAGPSESAEYTTTIPEGTKLLDLKVIEEGVKVDLSAEFLAGGGSASMSARLGQIIYTASSLDANTPIWISVEGKPLKNLGGEGIVLSQPMTRQEFDANFSL
jgi:spore germination protein GerM